MSDPKPKFRIENWTVVNYFGDERLHGAVYGHPHVPDGEWAFTSTLTSMNDSEAETRNSVYILGKKAANVARDC